MNTISESDDAPHVEANNAGEEALSSNNFWIWEQYQDYGEIDYIVWDEITLLTITKQGRKLQQQQVLECHWLMWKGAYTLRVRLVMQTFSTLIITF